MAIPLRKRNKDIGKQGRYMELVWSKMIKVCMLNMHARPTSGQHTAQNDRHGLQKLESPRHAGTIPTTLLSHHNSAECSLDNVFASLCRWFFTAPNWLSSCTTLRKNPAALHVNRCFDGVSRVFTVRQGKGNEI